MLEVNKIPLNYSHSKLHSTLTPYEVLIPTLKRSSLSLAGKKLSGQPNRTILHKITSTHKIYRYESLMK